MTPAAAVDFSVRASYDMLPDAPQSRGDPGGRFIWLRQGTETMPISGLLNSLTFRDGLVPVVIVEADGQVLTLCYMNEQALEATLRTGQVHVFRRSRGRMMRKGDSSGHVQKVRDVRMDCEGNSLMMVVEQTVAACHAGYRTCYYRRYDPKADRLEICEERIFDPEGVYGP